MTNRYTKRHSKISGDEKNSLGSDIPYIVNLREWANMRVRYYEKNRPKLPTIKTYKITGSAGNVYTITISENNDILCSCPGFTYRSSCKHIEKTSIKDCKPILWRSLRTVRSPSARSTSCLEQ